jgi:DNA-binding beta-propeller fold protein YncE
VKLQSLILALVLAGCSNAGNSVPPPLTQLYFPTGIAHVDVPGKEEGVLFVANANFDKRYASGSIVALPLDSLGLPALGLATGADGGPPTVKELTTLDIDPSWSVQIASFSGELGVQQLGPSTYRLYVPTRSEGMNVFRVQADLDSSGVPSLSCINESSRNCLPTGVSLTPRKFEVSDAGVPRAPAPYGVALAPRSCTVSADCCATGQADCGRSCSTGQCFGTDGAPFADVWVTHLTQADSPALSTANFRGYLVRMDSDTFVADEGNFINIGSGGANSVAVAGNWVYATGRILSPAPNLLRVVNRDGVVASTSLESYFRVSDARGIALSSDKKRMFVVGRAPDTLLIVNIIETGGIPILSFVRGIPLPDAPNQVRVISRPGRGDLVVVTCTSASSVAFYDDDVGDLVSMVGPLGAQPYGLAVDVRGNAARVFVSNFGDGRISVIDVPDLTRPQGARLVAHLGPQQLCLTRGAGSPGCLASQAGVTQ